MNADPALAPLLAERARRLARPIAGGPAAGAPAGLLQFRVGNESLAVASDAVTDVQPAPRQAPLPGLPPWLAGMVAIRGRILPAIWLDRFLAVSSAGTPDEAAADRAIVIHADGVQLALLATAVDGIAPAPDREPASLPGGLSPAAHACAAGIDRGRLIIDASRLVDAVSLALGSTTTAVDRPLGNGANQEEEKSHAHRT